MKSRPNQRRRITEQRGDRSSRRPQRPFKEPYQEEPDWLAAELAPPKLACETESKTE